MMRVTTTFLRGEVAASNREWKKSFPLWKQQETGQKQNFKKGGFQSQQRSKRKQDRFTLLTKTPKEILALDKGKFKPPPPMTTPVKKRNSSKFCEFHGENNGKDQAKTAKKGETSEKDKPLAILMTMISFPPLGEEDGTEGPMIIEAEVGGHFIHHMYVDGGSSLEILYEHCFNIFGSEVRRDEEHSTSAWMNFMVVRSPSPYNGIIGRLGPGVQQPVPDQVMEKKIQVAIHPEYPKQTIAIGSTLTKERRKELCGRFSTRFALFSKVYGRVAINRRLQGRLGRFLQHWLRRNLDVFAWKLADMTAIPRHIAEHRLNIREGCLPVRLKKRGQAPERNKAIHEEVEKLVEAGIMKEVHYHSWLSNPVMVKKHDDTWRMYADFKDLNKACPKDGYPLPEIDWKVESLCGYPFKCFLDAYKGYHQIKMAKEDEEKTTFITSQWIFCYSKMPLRLKNTIATYQCLVDKAFKKQIGRNLEVYVDDLVIKSRTEQEVIRDIEETFKTLREIKMKLNPKKCTFGMIEGTFLGYKVNADGLKVCPEADKVDAVLSLPSPGSEAEVAFGQMKKLIAELPMLTAPKEKEELIIYLAAAKEAISTVLMTERDGEQMHVYFVSRALQGPEINYTLIEKLKTALVLFTDGSPCIDGSGVGLILTSPNGIEFTYALRFGLKATNNEAEYEALIVGLRIAEQMGVKNLQAHVDSRLMANQVNESYVAKESGMIKYLDKVKTLASIFKEFSITQIPRGENKKADALSKIASTSFAHLSKQVLVEELKEKSIDEREVLAVVEEEGRTWITPIYEYLTKEILPKEKKKARAIHRKAGRYVVTNGVLYKRSFLRPWLRCVGPLEANYVLREIHEGSCSMHAGPRSVVAKALRSWYFWPTMHADARKLISECSDCQVHRPVPRNPQQSLTPITSPWPFYKWGIDIAGPFPEGPDKVKFLIVAVDYFTVTLPNGA
ncbi:reverse transcriptase domain-containing protein [Tanacetum coccineum]